MQPSILKNHKHSKMIETYFYRLYYIINWLQKHCWLSVKSMTPTFVVVVSIFIQFVDILAGVCHICAFLLKNLSRYKVLLLINGCEHLSVVSND